MGFTEEELKAMMDRVRERKRARTGPMVVGLVKEESVNKAHARKGRPSRGSGFTSLDVDPMGAPRMNKSDAWRGRPVVLRYRAFKDEVRRQCAETGWALGGTLDVEFRIPMPTSWPKKKCEEMNGKPHQQKPDVDNICKAVLDCFGEDKGVHTLIAKKVWAYAGEIIIRTNDDDIR